MIKIETTHTFAKWLRNLRDSRAKARVAVRIERIKDGNFGDVKPVGSGVSEMRIPCGPGYRVYFVQRGDELVILLAGGDKSTQDSDIKQAIEIAKNL
jgi:putative addiction module killer protein